MDPFLALGLAGALVAATLAVGFVVRLRSGRRRAHRVDTVEAAEIGVPTLGRTATIVQFSTELCSRCPGVRRALSALAASDDDLVFADVDLTHLPGLAQRFRVLQTPTVLVLDCRGRVAARYAGAVTGRTITAELETLRKDAGVTLV